MKSIEIIKQAKYVRFTHKYGEDFWYETDFGFQFPVPICEMAEAIFKSEDKPIYFKRWIDAYLKEEYEGTYQPVTFEHYENEKMWYKTPSGELFPITRIQWYEKMGHMMDMRDEIIKEAYAAWKEYLKTTEKA